MKGGRLYTDGAGYIYTEGAGFIDKVTIIYGRFRGESFIQKVQDTYVQKVQVL